MINTTKLQPAKLIKSMLAILITILFFNACKKEMSDQDNLQSRLASGMVSYVQGAINVSFNGNSYNYLTSYIGVPIRLSEAAAQSDSIICNVDTTMVAQYNTVYKENNAMIPQGAFGVNKNGRFAIESGQSQAKDSLSVQLLDGSKLTNGVTYLVPVNLASKNGSKLSYTLFFFKVYVTKTTLQSKVHGGNTFNNVSFSRSTLNPVLTAAFVGYPATMRLRTNVNVSFPANDTYIQAEMLTDAEINAAITKNVWTNNFVLPAAYRTLTKDLTTVPAKSLLSADSIVIRFNDKTNLTKSRFYVTGIKLKTYTSSIWGVPPVANDSARAYIRMFVAN